MQPINILETVLFTDISEQNVQTMQGFDAMNMMYVAGTIKKQLTIAGCIKTEMSSYDYLLKCVKLN